MRLTKEEYVCFLAFAASARSEDPFTKTGACLLDISGNVLGTGTNGLKPNIKVPEWMFWEEKRAKKSNLMIHAEQNLWNRKREGEEFLLGLTMSPCKSCSQLIASSKIKKVIFLQFYERGGRFFEKIFAFHGIEWSKLPDSGIARIKEMILENDWMLRLDDKEIDV